MSFVKKAVKSVFKVVKKVVSKAVSFVKRVVKSDWFKIAAIVALTVFTAGVGAIGFGAFSGVSSIGGFFGAVGSTMSAGWASITAGVSGMFGGGAGASVGAGTQPLMTAGLEGTGGLLGSGAAAGTGGAGFVSPLASNIAGAAAGGVASGATTITTSLYQSIPGAGGGKGILAKFGSLLMDKGIAGTMMRQGIMSGVQMYLQDKEQEREDFYRNNRTVWGGPAFGGSAEGDMPFLRLADDASAAQQQAATQGMTPLQQQQLEQEEQAQMQQAPQYAGLLDIGRYGPPQADPTMQQGAASAPITNQPPPAANPQQNSAPGLLNLETAGAYYG